MATLMSSGDTTGTAEFESPGAFMAKARKRYGKFTLDPAATKKNAKAPRFFTRRDDGLSQPWKSANVFVNPPYGRGLLRWVKKAVEETKAKRAKRVVMLLPARTDTKWFQQYVIPFASECWFIAGRITFELNGKPVRTLNKKTGKMVITPAPFPSLVVLFENDPGFCRFGAWS
jgi:site-specific DNA-methyltransferase (adenine-specific)